MRFNILSRKVLLFSLFILGLGFQNCSKVSVTDLSSLQPVAATGTASTDPQFMTATIGKDSVFPELKMVFVVDNSFSMQANNVNLSSSFKKMFDSQLSSSLAPFNTSIFVINTAQNSILPGEDRFDLLPKIEANTYSSRLFDSNFGSIPGDVIGYRLKYTSDTDGSYIASYAPAPVYGYSSQGSSDRILKPAAGSVAALSSEFQNRLAALDGGKIPMKFDAIAPLDNESGLCSLARMLNSSSNYFKTGDQASFVIASDEEDRFDDAAKCIASSSRSTDPNYQVFDGTCNSPATTVQLKKIRTRLNLQSTASYRSVLTVQKTVPAVNDVCNYDYVTGVAYSLSKSSTAVTNDSCIYDSANGISYQLKKLFYRTEISYWSNDEGACRLRDGIKVCDGGNRTKSIDGNLIANCLNAAVTLNDVSADLNKQIPTCKLITADNQIEANNLALSKLSSLPNVGACSAEVVGLFKTQGKIFDSCFITSVNRTGQVFSDLGTLNGDYINLCAAKAASV